MTKAARRPRRKTPETIAERVRAARAKTGLNQAAFGKRCRWSAQRQNNYEQGRREPSLEAIKTMHEVCRANGARVSLAYFIG